MAAKSLLKDCFRILDVCGVDPFKNGVWSNVKSTFTLVILSVTCVEIFLSCIFRWKGLNSMEDLTAFVGIYQQTVKFFIILINRQRVFDVITKMANFWPSDKFGKELNLEITTACTNVRRSIQLLFGMLMVIAAAYYIRPIFASSRQLPFNTYHPADLHQTTHYAITLFLQMLLLLVGLPSFIGLDGLFISLIITVSCELKMVKRAFKELKINPENKRQDEETLEEFYQVIAHHNLVLDCIKDVRNLYSTLLLNVYFNNMICMCVGLLCIIASGVTLDNFAQYGLYVVFYVIQLFFYCGTGSHLITESEDVSAAVYNTDWWVKTQPKLRRAYVMVIQRANKGEYLTAGGMFTLNLDSFRKVVRSALSLFTLVQALYNVH